MTLTKEQIEALELQREEAVQAVNKGEALKRLMSTTDYQLIISDAFLVEYPRDMADAIVKNTGAYDSDILANNIKALNVFVGFIMKIGADYNHAVASIEQIDNMLNGTLDDEVDGE